MSSLGLLDKIEHHDLYHLGDLVKNIGRTTITRCLGAVTDNIARCLE